MVTVCVDMQLEVETKVHLHRRVSVQVVLVPSGYADGLGSGRVGQ